MIPFSDTPVESENWQQELAAAFTDPLELVDFLEWDKAQRSALQLADSSFPFRVTRFYAALMEKNNPHDPLLRQVLPSIDETRSIGGYSHDPLGERHAHQGGGVLQKYPGRALLIASGACAIHCRYCFRRHFPYAEYNATRHNWNDALQFLAGRTDIREVILSGGDPLTLSNRRLRELIEKLERIPHLRRLRIHTRLPVVLPGRIDRELVSLLENNGLATSMVIHANHARELSVELAMAMESLQRSGITLLNQTVLLRGVNDCADSLQALCEQLYDMHVLPYYLHLLDKVAGAGHFAIGREDARTIHAALGERLPGYLLPRLVFEEVGATSKTPL